MTTTWLVGRFSPAPLGRCVAAADRRHQRVPGLRSATNSGLAGAGVARGRGSGRDHRRTFWNGVPGLYRRGCVERPGAVGAQAGEAGHDGPDAIGKPFAGWPTSPKAARTTERRWSSPSVAAASERPLLLPERPLLLPDFEPLRHSLSRKEWAQSGLTGLKVEVLSAGRAEFVTDAELVAAESTSHRRVQRGRRSSRKRRARCRPGGRRRRRGKGRGSGSRPDPDRGWAEDQLLVQSRRTAVHANRRPSWRYAPPVGGVRIRRASTRDRRTRARAARSGLHPVGEPLGLARIPGASQLAAGVGPHLLEVRGCTPISDSVPAGERVGSVVVIWPISRNGGRGWRQRQLPDRRSSAPRRSRRCAPCRARTAAVGPRHRPTQRVVDLECRRVPAEGPHLRDRPLTAVHQR